jgi:hypothetical protein
MARRCTCTCTCTCTVHIRVLYERWRGPDGNSSVRSSCTNRAEQDRNISLIPFERDGKGEGIPILPAARAQCCPSTARAFRAPPDASCAVNQPSLYKHSTTETPLKPRHKTPLLSLELYRHAPRTSGPHVASEPSPRRRSDFAWPSPTDLTSFRSHARRMGCSGVYLVDCAQSRSLAVGLPKRKTQTQRPCSSCSGEGPHAAAADGPRATERHCFLPMTS